METTSRPVIVQCPLCPSRRWALTAAYAQTRIEQHIASAHPLERDMADQDPHADAGSESADYAAQGIRGR
jgi:hypothetical protein